MSTRPFDHRLPLKKATGPLSGKQAMTDLSVVIGASTGLGYKLTKQCAEHGFDPIIAADEPLIAEIAEALQATGAKFEPVQAALGAREGIAKLCSAIGDRPVVALSANAGIVLERALPDQESNKAHRAVDINIMGPSNSCRRSRVAWRDCRAGRVILAGSMAGFMPGALSAVHNGTI
jgi:uncharacterized protein